MQLKFSFLTFLIYLVPQVTWSHAISAPTIIAALSEQNFRCTQKSLTDCVYYACQGRVASFSQDLLILVPAVVDSWRVHFHGHKLGVFPEYESSLSSMVSAFQLPLPICRAREAVVFPASAGKCDDYDQQLKSKAQLETFLNEVRQAMRISPASAAFHVSAHSGGGRTVGRILDAGISVDKLSVFDGIYSGSLKGKIKSWYELRRGNLQLSSVKGQGPDGHSLALLKEVQGPIKSQRIKLSGTMYELEASKRLWILRRGPGKDALKSHYDVVSETWEFRHEEEQR